MWSAVFRAFNGFMALLYIGVGALLIVAKPLFENFPPYAQPLFGIVLIVYGFFRIYRLLKEMWNERKGAKEPEYKEDDGEKVD